MARSVERELAASLTALRGYRQARWRAAILYGLAGSGKTALARALADDDHVRKAFRDGIAWADGSRDPQDEVRRLCLGFALERQPAERWHECWQRWAGAPERRLLLVVDDALLPEGLSPLVGGLGPQAVALITTQQGAEIRAEVKRWLPADAILAVGIHGLAPAEGRALVEAVALRPLTDAEWGLAQEVGERVGWHPEALRLAASEGREIGWAGMLHELRAGRMPWDAVKRPVWRQWARLRTDERGWLVTLAQGAAPAAWFASDAAAQRWQVAQPVAERRLWLLEHGGLVERQRGDRTEQPRWRVAPVAHLILADLASGQAGAAAHDYGSPSLSATGTSVL